MKLTTKQLETLKRTLGDKLVNISCRVAHSDTDFLGVKHELTNLKVAIDQAQESLGLVDNVTILPSVKTWMKQDKEEVAA